MKKNVTLRILEVFCDVNQNFCIFIIKINMKNTNDFIKIAQEIHKGKYLYEKAVYINAKTKLTITCKKHGDFLQTPNNHIYSKQGCLICAGLKKYSNEEIIEKFKKKHGEKYDYSLVEYFGMFKKVKILCKIHGIFEQTPKNHITGKGCGKCRGLHQTNTEIINRFQLIHDDLYDYLKTIYKNMKTKVIIICSKHGEFLQTPDTHLRGSGCPKCKNSKGESKIHKLLTDRKINFVPQKMFDKCRNPLTGKMLPFDFYLPDFKMCIEYDGEQHFKKMRFKKSNLEKIQMRDKEKTNYCKKNNIFLLRISYKEIKKIEDIINDHIS